MKRKTVKARKARAVKTKAFYKAPLNFVSNSFNSLASYFK